MWSRVGYTLEMEEQPTLLVRDPLVPWKKEGDTFSLTEKDGTQTKMQIMKVENAVTLAKEFGFNLQRDIPAYYLNTAPSKTANGAYVDRLDALLFYSGTSEITKRHEIIHAIEFRQEVTQELKTFFEKIKDIFPDGIEKDGLTFFNYRKDIHEFIADGYTHPLFISVLKEHNLYDEFLAVTKYLNVFI
ncbi:MAG: hypothetical protein JWN37_97 [Candidatus Nomurabacteria bacterium]|nr:hypothetical protein [Candidatus Nomurabacteria bacterium]